VLNNAGAMGQKRAAFEKRQEELQARRQALIDDPELARYRSEGWNKKGEERGGQNAAEARESHWRRAAFLRGEIGKVDQEQKRVQSAKDKNAQAGVTQGLTDMNLLLGQNKLQNQTIIQEMQKMNGYLAAVMGVA